MFENLQNQSTGLQQVSQTSQQSQMQQMKQQLQQMKEQLSMLQNAQNPQQMWQQLLNTNPKAKQAAEEASALYNGDAKAMFYAKARAQGLTDDQIDKMVSVLRSEMN